VAAFGSGAGMEILVVKTANRQTFTVSGTTEVSVAAAGSVPYLENSDGNTYFQRNDSLLILGVGIQLPYSFCAGTIPFLVTLKWYKDDGATTQSIGSMYIPYSNAEIPLYGGKSPGSFARFPSIIDDTWAGKARLAVEVTAGKVSVVNNPSALTGAFSIIPWIRVQHNLGLEASA
jgi:hypothetical protein